MNKSDYWNEKEHEKYERMKVGIELDDFDFEKAKKLSKITNRIIKAITIPAIVIGIATFIIVFLGTILYWRSMYRQMNPDIVGNLESIYNEKFKIVSYEKLGTREEIYTLSPKSNNKIKCTAYKKGTATFDDFQSQAYKYFVENILDDNIRNKLSIDEENNEEMGVSLLRYNAYLEPQNFSELEECIEYMSTIRTKAEEQDRRVYSYITSNSWIKIQNYHSNVQYGNNIEKDDLKKQEKYQYIQYSKENDIDTFKIPDEELEKYKPKYLGVILNGENLKEKYLEGGFPTSNAFSDFYKWHCSATYNEVIEEYEFKINDTLNFLDGVEVEKDLSNSVLAITYKGKKYKLQYETNEIEGEKFPNNCRMSYYEKYFGATIKYDYENELIYINL